MQYIYIEGQSRVGWALVGSSNRATSVHSSKKSNFFLIAKNVCPLKHDTCGVHFFEHRLTHYGADNFCICSDFWGRAPKTGMMYALLGQKLPPAHTFWTTSPRSWVGFGVAFVRVGNSKFFSHKTGQNFAGCAVSELLERCSTGWGNAIVRTTTKARTLARALVLGVGYNQQKLRYVFFCSTNRFCQRMSLQGGNR